MKGTVDIKVKNRHISFSLKLGRNVTVITGDSGTGKTKLINMIRDYSELGKSSGVSLVCDRKCIVLEGNNWEKVLDSISGSVVFVEESTKFINSYDFADAIQKTDNYYVLVTREPLPQLPYSVDCIMNIEKHGKNPKIVPRYKNLSVKDISKFLYDVIVMEDSNSGFQLFELASEGFGLQCVSAYGKTKILAELKKYIGKRILVVADAAAFGSEIRDLEKYRKIHNNIDLFLPESFEWMILKSKVIGADPGIDEILLNPVDYIESKDCFSWERFFEKLLTEKTRDLRHFRYNKTRLAKGYQSKANIEKIINVMND